MAEGGGWTAVRVRVRREREIRLGNPRRHRAVLRPAGREHRVLDPRQSADRDCNGPSERGQLSTLGKGLAPQPVPALVTFQYHAQIPSSWQWQAGFQSLPFGMVGDVMYVGNHGYNRLGSLQGGTQQPINSVDFGAAYLPKNQDPTLGAATYPGQTAYTTNLLRPYLGFNGIGQNTTGFYDTYHSIQMTVNRRFGRGFSFGANYTYGISLKGNTGLSQRYQHAPDGTLSLRSDEQAYENLLSTLDRRPHFLKANLIWLSPGIKGNAFLEQVTKDWQIASVVTASSGAAYSAGYSYNSAGANVNITGSPDWGGRVILGNNLGSGSSSDRERPVKPGESATDFL